MVANANDSIVSARSGARKLAIIYIGVLAFWVVLQSGVALYPLLEQDVADIQWAQTIAGWFFALALGWLLYLLIARGLKIIEDAQEALRLRDRALESSVNGVLIFDYLRRDGPIVYVNPAFEQMTGYTREEALGRKPEFLVGSDLAQPELEALQAAVKDGRHYRAVLRTYRKEGDPMWTEAHVAPVRSAPDRVTHYVAILHDISETRRYQEELAHQANYDVLTGLPNRNLLTDRIGHAISRAGRSGNSIAVCVLGMNQFGRINDSLGYAVGSELLVAIAARLQSRLRAVDTVARLAGDEFAILLVDETTEAGTARQVQRVLEGFTEAFVLQGRDVFVGASVGVTLYPQDGGDAETLLKRAEIAMHRAKEQGDVAFHMFTPEMDARVAERLSLESALRRAVERGELLLHYQPQVDLAAARICGMEALVRWNHPDLGMVSPARFIPLAEETGLVVPIGDWVLRTACAQSRAWQQAGLEPVRVSVNVSARQFRQRDLTGSVAAALRDTGLDPRYLELELTESIIMQDVEAVIAIMRELKALGGELAIDDFGTGYSSLAYLRRFPVDRLKIDQSFVREIVTDRDAQAIAQAVISLGKALGLRVIAEGVETREQAQFLARHGCHEVQGYLYARPQAAENITALLGKGLAVTL
jgi:diguanylate cyclase (GGDEF)-like protein/PAS domain S-box-containing protein